MSSISRQIICTALCARQLFDFRSFVYIHDIFKSQILTIIEFKTKNTFNVGSSKFDFKTGVFNIGSVGTYVKSNPFIVSFSELTLNHDIDSARTYVKSKVILSEFEQKSTLYIIYNGSF